MDPSTPILLSANPERLANLRSTDARHDIGTLTSPALLIGFIAVTFRRFLCRIWGDTRANSARMQPQATEGYPKSYSGEAAPSFDSGRRKVNYLPTLEGLERLCGSARGISRFCGDIHRYYSTQVCAEISLYTEGAKLGCLLGGSEDCASPQPRSGQRSGVCLGRGCDVRLCTLCERI
jgi:hypothetical protein